MDAAIVDKFFERLDTKQSLDRIEIYLSSGEKFDEIRSSHITRVDNILVWNDGALLAFIEISAIIAIKKYHAGY